MKKVQILVLQRGFVVVGYVSHEGHFTIVESSMFIRRWGTKRGLGEIANGPTANTVLDMGGRQTIHPLQIILSIDCSESGWAKHLETQPIK